MSEVALPPTPADVLNAVVEITREATAGATEASVADAVVRISARLTGADQGTLGMVRDDEVVIVAAVTPPRQPVGSHFPVGFGVAGWVAATGRPAEIQDVRQDKRYVALPYPEVRSFVGMPLESGGKLVGVLSLAAWRPGAFAPNTAGALAPLTEIAALLLGHAAVDDDLRQQLVTLETSASEGLAESLHELKSPLHAASGFVDIVAEEKSGPLNEQQKDFLNTARAEFGRVKEALATLVEVGAAAAQRPLHLELVEASEIVAEAVQRFTGQALRTDVRLVEQSDPSAAPVRADRAAIQQVLANFVQNALRVVPAGSEIVVATSRMPDWTCFSVADRGPGLPDGDPARLFEPFQQGDSRSGAREAGTVGLGLSLSKKIVEQHQGMIWAENRDGGGSQFFFALPSASRD